MDGRNVIEVDEISVRTATRYLDHLLVRPFAKFVVLFWQEVEEDVNIIS